jgi:pyridoxal phosphate enzyme (YggS family)
MTVKTRLEKVKRRISDAAKDCGRSPESIKLVAVSKTVGSDRVGKAIDAGVTILGENYIQEAKEKFAALSDRPVKWHFIGHLQSNKAKYAVRMFDLIHSVDSIKLAKALDKEARKNAKVQDILVQVNISREETKTGIDPSEATDLISRIADLDHIRVLGLMTMPPFFDDPESARPFFQQLAALKEKIKGHNIAGTQMDELSMGMTGDFEVAIEEGATLVRIGTAIFGERL